jgi:hypothetical protein
MTVYFFSNMKYIRKKVKKMGSGNGNRKNKRVKSS